MTIPATQTVAGAGVRRAGVDQLGVSVGSLQAGV